MHLLKVFPLSDFIRSMFFGSRQEHFVATDDSKKNPQLTFGVDTDTIAARRITNVKKVKILSQNSGNNRLLAFKYFFTKLSIVTI